MLIRISEGWGSPAAVLKPTLDSPGNDASVGRGNAADRERVVACGALRVYTEELAEVCSLAVDPPLQRAGVGRAVVEQLVADARGLGVHTVFALTLRPDFFGRLGFRVVAKKDFPLKVWADCRNCPKLHACDEIAVAIDLGGRRC
ncbi:MAG: GNAT family N-acetyltransferase [Gemmatimonadota bacterium]